MVIAQVFNQTAELAMPIGIPTKETKAEIESHPVTKKLKKVSVQYKLTLHKPFCASCSSTHFGLFLQ